MKSGSRISRWALKRQYMLDAIYSKFETRIVNCMCVVVVVVVVVVCFTLNLTPW